MSSLTPKQETFVQAIIKGKSQRQAYKEAYDTSKMKDETIDNRAYQLFKKDEVKARYNELMEEHKNKALYTREEAIKDLIWIKEKAKADISNPKIGLRQANGTIYLNSVKELSLLEDLYPDKKAKDDDKTEKEIAKILKEAMEDI